MFMLFISIDLEYYGEGIPSTVLCGYCLLIETLLCRNYPMLKYLSFLGVSQDLVVSQTGYLTSHESV